MASGEAGAKVVISAISGNFFITIIKFIGWGMTASPSLLAEAIHSLADTSNQILLYIGIRQSSKDISREHPTGYGRARYLWSLISAVGIFFIGFGVTAYHGIHSLVAADTHQATFSWIAVGILLVSFVIEFIVLVQAYRVVNEQRGSRGFIQFLRESDDPTTVAILLEDGVAVLGVTLAIVGIGFGQLFHSPLFDIGAALLIAGLLGFMALALAFINGKLLLGKSLTIHQEEEIREFVEQLPAVLRIERFETNVLGAGEVRLSLEIELHGETMIDVQALVEDAKRIESGTAAQKVLFKASERMVRKVGKVINEIEMSIQRQFPEIKYIDFEVN